MAKGSVTGDKEIIANMRRIRTAIGGRAMDEDCLESLEPMRQDTEDNARRHRQTGYTPPGGHLDENVVKRKTESRGSLKREYWISFRRRGKKLAHLLEYGTAPHYQPKRRIMHPGARAFPFFRPAFEANKDAVAEDIGNAVWRRILAAIAGTKK